MSDVQYSIVQTRSGEANIMALIDGVPFTAHSSHPSFSIIIQTLTLGSEDEQANIAQLFDAEQALGVRFERLSDRVTVAGGKLYLDGDEMEDALTKQILRFLEEGVDDFQPLVKFLENVQANPNEHSRQQLYSWLKSHDLTITEEGMLVGYKSLDLADGYLGQSTVSGLGIINGVEVNDYHKLNIGDVVEMPRSKVNHDPSQTCSSGLHVAAWEYAAGFYRRALIAELEVNPRDVVSVPDDYNGQKVRVCRYKVVGQLDNPYTTALRGFDPERDGFDVDTAFDASDDEDSNGTLEEAQERVRVAENDLQAEQRYLDSLYGTRASSSYIAEQEVDVERAEEELEAAQAALEAIE